MSDVCVHCLVLGGVCPLHKGGKLTGKPCQHEKKQPECSQDRNFPCSCRCHQYENLKVYWGSDEDL